MKSLRTRTLATASILAVGLSTAAAAGPAFAGVRADDSNRIQGALVFGDAASGYTAITAPTSGLNHGVVVKNLVPSLAEASATADSFSLPGPGETGSIQANGRCFVDVPVVELVDCDPKASVQQFDTVRVGDTFQIRKARFNQASLGAANNRLSMRLVGEPGYVQSIVAGNFTTETGEPPAAGVALKNVFAFQTAGAAVIGGRVEAGATLDIAVNGTKVGKTTAGHAATLDLFGYLALGASAGDEVTVVATTKDGRTATTTTTVDPRPAGPISAETATVKGDTVTITGRATAGSAISVTGLVDPYSIGGGGTTGDDGRYTVKGKILGKASSTPSDLIVKVRQVGATGSADAYIRATIDSEGTHAVPTVFSYSDGTAGTRLAGFAVDKDGYLTSADPDAADYDAAAKGATTLKYTFGAVAPLTDESGERCLIEPTHLDGTDWRPRLLACDDATSQNWKISDSGEIFSELSSLNLAAMPSADGKSASLEARWGSEHNVTLTAPQLITEQATAKSEIVGDDLSFTGTAMPGSLITLHVAVDGVDTVVSSDTVGTKGEWQANVLAQVLQRSTDAKVTVVDSHLAQEQKIAFAVDAKNVVEIDSLKDGDTITGGKAVISGTALVGAEVIVKDGDTVVGKGTATAAKGGKASGDAGVYSIAVDGLAAGPHTLTVQQSQNAHVITRDSVDITATPAADAPLITTKLDRIDAANHSATISGTTIPNGTVIVNEWESVNADAQGRWSFTVQDLVDGQNTIDTYLFTNKVAAVSTPISATIGSATDRGFTAHAKQTSEGRIRVSGLADPNTSVSILSNLIGGSVSTPTDSKGAYSVDVDRGFGNLQVFRVSVTDKVNPARSATLDLDADAGETIAPVVVTGPAAGSTVTTSRPVFTGTGQAKATVTIGYGTTTIGTTKVKDDGTWTLTPTKGLGLGTSTLQITQTSGTDTQRTTHQINRTDGSAPAPVKVTSITDGATYKPGLNILKGTGTPGAKVAAVNATNGWNVPMGQATVAENGTWALPERNWGPSNDYQIKVTQTNPDTTTSTTTVTIKAPIAKKLVVDGFTVGAVDGAGVKATFTGTSTAFARVAITSSKTPTTYQTVTADARGVWAATRTWDPKHTYSLRFEATTATGVETVAYGSFQAK